MQASSRRCPASAREVGTLDAFPERPVLRLPLLRKRHLPCSRCCDDLLASSDRLGGSCSTAMREQRFCFVEGEVARKTSTFRLKLARARALSLWIGGHSMSPGSVEAFWPDLRRALGCGVCWITTVPSAKIDESRSAADAEGTCLDSLQV
eukprot:Skav235533  [mRNA]  locus=scaffold3067:71548:71997:+ [translate_table: standard]